MTTGRTVTLHINLETNELFKANLGAFFSRSRSVVIFIGGIVLAGALLAFARWQASGDTIHDLFAELAPLLVLLGVSCFTLPISVWFAARKAVNDPRAKSGFFYTLSDSGINSEGSAGRTQMNWSAFLRARETPASFQLYVTKATFHFLPKRCFSSPSDIAFAREIIRTHIPVAQLFA